MTIAKSSEIKNLTLPDHTQLPDSDGTFVKNFQEHPQSILLTDSIQSTLESLHPDRQYAIGQDCGIYWRLTEPPEKGAECPDWFYVPNVPPTLDAIYEVQKKSVEVYHLIEDRYELVAENERGHYPIQPMGVELGIWQGQYGNLDLPWLRWWDSEGNLLLTGDERSRIERERAERAELELEQERQRAERLAELLRSQGINPEEL